jgi:hypothetical protein
LNTLHHFIKFRFFLRLFLGKHLDVLGCIATDLVLYQLRAFFVINDPMHLANRSSNQDRVYIDSNNHLRVIKSSDMGRNGSDVATDIE